MSCNVCSGLRRSHARRSPQEEHLWCTLMGLNSPAPPRQTSSRRRASSRSRAIALLRWKRDVPYTVKRLADQIFCQAPSCEALELIEVDEERAALGRIYFGTAEGGQGNDCDEKRAQE
jgi:hypothetical protein